VGESHRDVRRFHLKRSVSTGKKNWTEILQFPCQDWSFVLGTVTVLARSNFELVGRGLRWVLASQCKIFGTILTDVESRWVRHPTNVTAHSCRKNTLAPCERPLNLLDLQSPKLHISKVMECAPSVAVLLSSLRYCLLSFQFTRAITKWTDKTRVRYVSTNATAVRVSPKPPHLKNSGTGYETRF
jgi:hypothetical protein